MGGRGRDIIRADKEGYQFWLISNAVILLDGLCQVMNTTTGLREWIIFPLEVCKSFKDIIEHSRESLVMAGCFAFC